ncbi:riboflavin kinase-like [Amphibalanus amphitrite]|uniref:riboflavin kinase-like n=1 Tax=Amphibalanus amphitrite TaxID=1232801 RepID=UPI001C8FE8CB|nr:riboflavin kinase-like [Amphibalanus amphitrite]
MTVKGLPFFAVGKVVKGFGRGSKELGIPTANFPEAVVERLPAAVGTGVYFGYARVDEGPVHNMVMSIGWNPFYKNDKKSMETHILHKFDKDFYGSTLRICIVGFIRPEENFKSLEALIRAINDDIEMARELCARPEHAALAKADFFYQTGDGTEGDSDGPGGSSVGRVERSGSDTSIDH